MTERPTNTEGQRGTYGCACWSRDSAECAAARYGFDFMHEHCDCACHQWDDDDEYGAAQEQTPPAPSAQEARDD